MNNTINIISKIVLFDTDSVALDVLIKANKSVSEENLELALKDARLYFSRRMTRPFFIHKLKKYGFVEFELPKE